MRYDWYSVLVLNQVFIIVFPITDYGTIYYYVKYL
jgi:hypothetical protein